MKIGNALFALFLLQWEPKRAYKNEYQYVQNV